MNEEAPPEDEYKFAPFPRTQGGLKIIQYNKETKNLELQEETLATILLEPRIKNRYVTIISVAGAFRQGKSLLLNFFLFYLELKYGKKITNHKWLDPKYGKIQGFHFKHGSERDTEGILIWREIFLATLAGGKKVAIILMDTQGGFDGKSSLAEFSTLFTLSSIISSVQIYNLMRQITSEDLNHLEYFAGRNSLLGSKSSKFQKLWFLVRDWSCAYEQPFGMRGGQNFLEKVFRNEDNSEQTKTVVANLENMIDSISCCLLPPPGDAVATAGTFQGEIKDLNENFARHVESFVEQLLAPENLVLKQYRGELLTAGQLFEHIKKYTEIFHNPDLPQIKESLFEMHRKEYVKDQIKSCDSLYTNLLKLGRYSEFEQIQNDCLEAVVSHFKEICGHCISPTELVVVMQQLTDSLDLLRFKMKHEHEANKTEDEKFFNNSFKKHIAAYEKSIESEYNDETEFLTEYEFTRKHLTAENETKQQFKQEINDFLNGIQERVFADASKIIEEILNDTNTEKWANYSEYIHIRNTNKPNVVLSKFSKLLQVAHKKKLRQNNDKRETAITENTTRFQTESTILLREYKTKLEEFAEKRKYLDDKDRFINRFTAEHWKIRIGIMRKFARIRVTKHLECIRDEHRDRLLEELERDFQRNRKGLIKIFIIIKVVNFIGLNAAIMAIGAVIAVFAPAGGFLAIIARIISWMPK